MDDLVQEMKKSITIQSLEQQRDVDDEIQRIATDDDKVVIVKNINGVVIDGHNYNINKQTIIMTK